MDRSSEDVGVGWVIEAEPQNDGRFLICRIVEDPGVVSMSGHPLPYGFAGSEPFGRFGERIVALGGNWEIVAGGLHSAWVPHASAEAVEFDFTRAPECAKEREHLSALEARAEGKEPAGSRWTALARGLRRRRVRSGAWLSALP